MTRLAFTGPTRLTPRDEGLLRSALRLLATPDEGPLDPGFTEPEAIHTGGAPGWDILAAREALHLFPDARHRIFVPDAPYATAEVTALQKHAARIGADLVVVNCSTGGGRVAASRAYRVRNEWMLGPPPAVPTVDALVAGLRRPTFYRSGEWMTVNIARRRSIPIVTVDLGGT